MYIEVNDILVNEITIISDNESTVLCNFYKVRDITPSGCTLRLSPLKKEYIETNSSTAKVIPTDKACGKMFEVRVCSEYKNSIRTNFIIDMEQNDIRNLCHIFTIYLQKYDSSKEYFQAIRIKPE